MTDIFSLQDKIILLTGSTGHLGRATARQLCVAGAHLLLNSRSLDKTQAQQDELRAMGYQATAMSFDITDISAVRKSYEFIVDKFGRLDGLVNNAYTSTQGGIKVATRDAFSESLDLNITAPFFLIREGLNLFLKSPSPSIVNIASMYGIVSPDPAMYEQDMENPPYYGAGKAGLIQVTRYLACFLGEHNIRVNSISPGPFPRELDNRSKEEFHNALAGKCALKRTGKPEELSGSIQFLLSDAASFITGTNLVVDGGWTAW